MLIGLAVVLSLAAGSIGAAQSGRMTDAARTPAPPSTTTPGSTTPVPPAPPAPSVPASPSPAPSSTPTRTPHPSPAPGHAALESLATLPVKGRAAKTGYARDQFGQRWLDVDRNGCDTRNDILGAQLTDVVRAGRCKVTSGTLADPYTATTIDFVRGQGTSELVQIDHVVALSDAWQKGAQALTLDQRARFANDPLNLLAVSGRTNASKGDGDAATWLPPNKAFRCEYVARQVAVKATYRLWVTQAEHDAIHRILSTCTDELISMPAATPIPVASTPAPLPPDAFYKNCADVRAHGAAPIRVGDPGYSRRLDGDGDGIGCE